RGRLRAAPRPARRSSPRGSRARCRSAGRRGPARWPFSRNPPRIIGPVNRALPKNAELAAQFDLLADLMEIQGRDLFRVTAYRKAATRIRETSSSVAQLALDGRAKELQGIGKTIEEKIVQAIETGEVDALTKRKAEAPPEVATFIRLPGLGPKTARRLWQELGITTVDALRAAAGAHPLRGLAGRRAKG